MITLILFVALVMLGAGFFIGWLSCAMHVERKPDPRTNELLHWRQLEEQARERHRTVMRQLEGYPYPWHHR